MKKPKPPKVVWLFWPTNGKSGVVWFVKPSYEALTPINDSAQRKAVRYVLAPTKSKRSLAAEVFKDARPSTAAERKAFDAVAKRLMTKPKRRKRNVGRR